MKYRGIDVFYKFEKYYNGNLALTIKDMTGELYGIATVNLDEELSNKNCAFLDTNNMPDIEEWIVKNKLAKPTGVYGFSGFCAYPEYEFFCEGTSYIDF